MKDAVDHDPDQRIAEDDPEIPVLREQLDIVSDSVKGKSLRHQPVVEEGTSDHHAERYCEDQQENSACRQKKQYDPREFFFTHLHLLPTSRAGTFGKRSAVLIKCAAAATP